jgi:hypothetical protein
LEPRQRPNHQIACPNPTQLVFRSGQVVFAENLPKPDSRPVGSQVRFGSASLITILRCNPLSNLS